MFWMSLEQFEKVMTCSIENGHHLCKACLQEGYRIPYWLAYPSEERSPRHARSRDHTLTSEAGRTKLTLTESLQ